MTGADPTAAARERAVGAFRRSWGETPRFLVRAPGRVNLLGEHVDYNEGLCLPAAIDRAVWLAGSPAPVLEVWSEDLRAGACFEDPFRASADGWPRIPLAVARELRSRGLAAPGLRAAVASDVPAGAGLSSSAALEVAFLLAWRALGGWTMPPDGMARLCQAAENTGLGVASGILDPFAILHGRADHTVLLDCRSLAWKAVPIGRELAIVVADTGVARRLDDTAYNRRRAECEEALAILRREDPGLGCLRDVKVEALAEAERRLGATLARRVRHVVEEIARVEAVAAVPESERPVALGAAMIESHRSLRALYEVSSIELDAMVDVALGLPGCLGSRLTGAGFGGCTVSLVAADAAAEICQALPRLYEQRTGRTGRSWTCRAADGAALSP